MAGEGAERLPRRVGPESDHVLFTGRGHALAIVAERNRVDPAGEAVAVGAPAQSVLTDTAGRARAVLVCVGVFRIPSHEPSRGVRRSIPQT